MSRVSCSVSSTLDEREDDGVRGMKGGKDILT